MLIEQDGRKLVRIDDDEFWDELPKDLRALPVYYRRTATGIEVWPVWPDYIENPSIRVTP